MNPRWFKPIRIVAFAALALFTASCSEPTPITAPPIAAQHSVASSYTLLPDPLPLTLNLNDLLSTQLIGISGGSVTLLGHTISVPRGAVTTPTFFTIAALPTGKVEVDLVALAPNLLGNLLSVGQFGFAKPVTLTLTYARSGTVDPSKLVIVYESSTGFQPLPTTVDTAHKTASAQLPHFSKYGLASN